MVNKGTGQLKEEIEYYKKRLDEEIAQNKELKDKADYAENQLAIFFDASGDAFWEINLKTGSTFFSPKYKELLGYDENDSFFSISSDLRHRIHPDDIKRTQKIYNQLIDGQISSFVFDCRILCRDETYKWVLTRGKVAEKNRVIWVLTDISDIKRMEEELKRNTELLQLAIDGVGDAVWDYNIQTGKIFYSTKLKTILGYDEDDFLSNEIIIWGEITHPEDKPTVDQLMNEHIKGNTEEFISEHRLMCKNGSYKWMLDRGKIISRKDDGTPEKFVGIYSDINKTKEIELALKDSEEKFRLIFDNSDVGITLCDSNGIYIKLNSAFADMLGYTQEEFSHLKMKDVTFHEDLKKTKIFIDKLKSGELNFFKQEKRLVKKNGDIIWVKVNVSIYHNISENDSYFISVIEEITEQRKIREALAESEAKFRDLAELLPELVFEFDKGGSLTFVNIIGLEMMGYTREDVAAGKLNAIQMIAPEEVDIVMKNIKKKLQGKNPATREYLMKRKDGSLFPGIIYSTPVLHNGQPVGVRGIIIDITESKNMEEALRLSEQKYKHLLEDAAAGIFVINISGECILVNTKASEIFGYTKEEFYKLKLNDFIYKDDLCNVYKQMDFDLMNKGETVTVECRLQSKKNILIDAEISLKMLDDANIQGIVHDISERKRTEKEIIKAKDEADRANMAKSEFLANMSHEIRTPLTAIIGTSDLLAESEINDVQLKYINILRNSGENLLTLINNVLDISKIESSYINLKNDEFDLIKTIESNIALMSIRAREKNTILNYRTDTKIPPILIGDTNRLSQILINLIGNAVKFTQNGKIYIEVSKNKIFKKQNTIELKFLIADTGEGIAPEEANKVFDKFFQVASSAYKGSGLGLYISRKLVELMGGKMWVESQVGKGSQFYFTIKLKIGSPVISQENKKEPDSNNYIYNKSLNILIAEDDKYNRIILNDYFINTYHRVDIVENGKLAFEKFKANNYDFVLMDIQMPIMDGYTTTQEIRKWENKINKSPAPIVALTAYAFKEDVEKCIQAGCTGYISKPVKKQALLDIITKYTGVITRKENNHPEENNKEKFFKKMQLELLKDINGNIKYVYEAINNNDFPEIERFFHKFKGTASFYNLNELAEIALNINKSAKDQNMEQIKIYMNKFMTKLNIYLEANL